MVDAVTLGALKRISFPGFNHASMNLTAGTTQTQAGATQINSMIARVTTNATAGNGIRLPAGPGGKMITVINTTANAVNLYPFNSTDAIDSLGAGNAYSLPAGANVTFTGAAAGAWYSDASANQAFSAAAAVAAAGTTQGGATQLTAALNNVATGTANQGVILPAAVPGTRVVVNNATGATIKVYPQGTGTIDGGSASAAQTLTSAHRGAEFFCFVAGAWVSSIFGAATT